MEKRITESYSKKKEKVFVRIVGPEMPLSVWGAEIIGKIQKQYPQAQFSLDVMQNDEALAAVNNYSADLALTCSLPAGQSTKMYRKLEDIEFKTFASKRHPLAKRKNAIPVAEVLDRQFAVVDEMLIGRKSSNQSADGWRDDKLKRTNIVTGASLKCLDSLLQKGLAVSYLPDYYGHELGLKPLEILNCPFSCKQSVYLVRNKYSLDSVWSLVV